MRLDKQDHRSLTLWATDCAEHVLQYCAERYSKDARPRNAIEAGRAWAREETQMSEAHAPHAATYAVKAAAFASTEVPTDSAAATAKERGWQYRRLPEHLWPVATVRNSN